MANIKITATGFAELERALREIPDQVEQALQDAATQMAADGLAIWRKVTPKVTGALRNSMRVERNGLRLYFYLDFPGDLYYQKIDARHKMTKTLIKWFRTRYRRYIMRELARIGRR